MLKVDGRPLPPGPLLRTGVPCSYAVFGDGPRGGPSLCGAPSWGAWVPVVPYDRVPGGEVLGSPLTLLIPRRVRFLCPLHLSLDPDWEEAGWRRATEDELVVLSVMGS